jgi:uncharacterized protein (TIGR00290 family)
VVKPRAAISWSGGKDCCTALMRMHRDYDIVAMITMLAEDGARSRSHGLRPDVLGAHAQRLGIHSLTGRCSWQSYTEEYIRLLGEASAMGVTHVIFGDILGDAHREWDEGVCAVHGLTAVLPLWGASTRDVVREFIETGSKAIIVTARAAYLDSTWLGRVVNLETVEELESRGIDPCGEFGEYHTVVTSCPLFIAPLELTSGVCEMHSDCWALDVTLSPPVGDVATLDAASTSAGPISTSVAPAFRRTSDHAPS